MTSLYVGGCDEAARGISVGSPECILPWVALRTRRNHEQVVSDCLAAQGIEVYLPTRVECRRWSQRVKRLTVPLFPGYLFARYSMAQRVAILASRGVVEMLGSGRKPSFVPEDEIAGVRQFVAASESCVHYPGLVPGVSVRVTHGPLMGLTGVLHQVDRIDRFVMHVRTLGQSVGVEIDPGLLEAA